MRHARDVATASACVLAFASLSGVARAEQVVVFDSAWTHTPETPDSHYRQPPLATTPSNWVSPVDYSQGSAYVHLEVFTKPTDTPTRFQVCFEATPTYACTDQSPTYTTTGVVDWGTPFADFWSPPGESVDWTQGTNSIAVILKDTVNGKPSAANVGAETAALYTPTDVHVVVTLVAPGSTYVPPSDAGAAPDGGGTGGAASGSAGGASAGGGTARGGNVGSGNTGGRTNDGGAGAGGAVAVGVGGASSSGGASGDGPDPDGSTPGDAAADSSAKRKHSGDDGGCSVTAVGPHEVPAGNAWAWVVVAAVAVVRRRIRGEAFHPGDDARLQITPALRKLLPRRFRDPAPCTSVRDRAGA